MNERRKFIFCSNTLIKVSALKKQTLTPKNTHTRRRARAHTKIIKQKLFSHSSVIKWQENKKKKTPHFQTMDNGREVLRIIKMSCVTGYFVRTQSQKFLSRR